MEISESLVNNLLVEVESLKCRTRSIKQCFKMTCNIRLRERLIKENKFIFERVNEIYKVANLLNTRNVDKISFSSLLLEKSRRTLDETKSEINLFFL